MSQQKKEPYSKKIMLITPQIAQEWIDELNKHNYRAPRYGKVHEYAAKMANNKWLPRHIDAIQFDWFGNLKQGQHRLLAVIESGVSIEMYVERGVDPDVFQFSDKLAVRTLQDDLTAANFRRDVVAKAGPIARRMLAGVTSTMPDSDEVKDFALQHENLIAFMQLILKRATPYRSEVVAAYAKATFEWSDDLVQASAERYASKRFTGDPADPLAKLHDKVIQFRVQGGKPHELYSLAVSAIRADLEGRTLRQIYTTDKDFLGPWQEGYIPKERREKGRKGAETRIKELKATTNRDEKAQNVLMKARVHGIKFLTTGEPVFPKKTNPHLIREVKEFLPEIKEILGQERGAVVE